MPLPINITEVLHGKTVEPARHASQEKVLGGEAGGWERLEFKKGWDSELRSAQ